MKLPYYRGPRHVLTTDPVGTPQQTVARRSINKKLLDGILQSKSVVRKNALSLA